MAHTDSGAGTGEGAPAAKKKPHWLAFPLAGRRLSKRARWLLRLAVMVPVVVVVGAVLLMRSPLVGMVLRSQLRVLLGCEFRARSAYISLSGQLIVRGLSLRVPGLDGEAGEFLSAETAVADLDWIGLVATGELRPTVLTLDGPLFRVSVANAPQPGEVNLAGLQPRSGKAPRFDQPPRIDVLGGMLELGEHAPGRYDRLTRIGVAGAVVANNPAKPVYSVKFHQVTARPTTGNPGSPLPGASSQGKPPFLSGTLDLQMSRASLVLQNLDLAAWRPSEVPSYIRGVWRALDIQGQISQTDFRFDPVAGLSAELTVSKVSMETPVPAFTETGEDTTDMISLREVSGTIRVSPLALHAELDGLVEDQTEPSKVILDTKGMSLNAALSCRIISNGFSISKDHSRLPVLPLNVREKLAKFSSPTAVVDAEVLLERDPPTVSNVPVPAPLRVSGKLKLEHGAAAFDKFPYPFEDMSGEVEFDEHKVVIKRLTGRGPTGARLSATGLIAPPDQTSEVTVDVVVTDVPVDEHLVRAMPPDRVPILDFLFNREAYERLRGRGLILSGADKAALQAELLQELAEHPHADWEAGGGVEPAVETPADLAVRRLRERLEAPVFELGGVADLTIHVHAPRGKDSLWEYTVTASFEKAGLVPRSFPMPVFGHDVAVEFGPDEARLLAGTFAGATGGTARVETRVVLQENNRPVVKPFVKVEADGVPVDELLLSALPGDRERAGTPSTTSASPRVTDLLRQLNISGTVSAVADITPPKEPTDPGVAFDVNVDVRALAARPAVLGRSPELILSDLEGAVLVSARRLAVPSITGTLRRIADADPRHTAGSLSISLVADLPRRVGAGSASPPASSPVPPDPGVPEPSGKIENMNISVAGRDFDLTAPIENIVEVFSAKSAAAVRALREKRRPIGRVDGLVAVDQRAGGPVDLTVRATGANGVVLTALGRRMTVGYSHGDAVFRTAGEDTLVFDDTVVDVGIEGDPAPPIRLNLTGDLVVAPDPANPDAHRPELRVSTTTAPFESAAVRAALAQSFPPSTLARYDQFDPRGTFDAEFFMSYRRRPGSPPEAEPVLAIRGQVSPRTLIIAAEQADIAFETVSGVIAIDGGSGRVESLAAATADWNVRLDGAWRTELNDDVVIEASGEFHALSLDSSIRDALPPAARDLISRIGLALPGPMDLADVRISTVRSQEPARRSGSVSGTFTFRDGGINIGVPVQECDGALAFSVDRPAGATAAKMDFSLIADRLTIAGLALTGLRSRLVTGTAPGTMLIPYLAAECYGGRITAEGSLRTDPASAGPALSVDSSSTDSAQARRPTHFRLEAAMSDVRLGEVVAALTRDPALAPEPNGPDANRGRVDAALAVSGVLGQPESREGRGSVRVHGGNIVNMPLALSLVQLSNFQLPSDDQLDYLQSSFHIAGPRLVFENISLLSRTLSLNGWGNMTWPSLGLNLRFTSRSAQRVPLWTDLVEALRDELVTATVTGTLGKPQVGVSTFANTRRLLGSIVGADAGAADALDGTIDRAAREERERVRRIPVVAPSAPVADADQE